MAARPPCKPSMRALKLETVRDDAGAGGAIGAMAAIEDAKSDIDTPTQQLLSFEFCIS